MSCFVMPYPLIFQITQDDRVSFQASQFLGLHAWMLLKLLFCIQSRLKLCHKYGFSSLHLILNFFVLLPVILLRPTLIKQRCLQAHSSVAQDENKPF